jgi:hypothetical protein
MKNNLSRRVFIQKGVTAGIGLAVMKPVFSAIGSGSIVLAEKGKARAKIILSDNPSQIEVFAASELSTYLNKITGAKFPISGSKEKLNGTSIIIRRGEENLGPEGFHILTQGSDLLLTGYDEAGIEFAVYTFLEKYLGVRWLWPGELGEVVPSKGTLTIGIIDDIQRPDFLWRNRGPAGALWGAATGPTEMHARELSMGITKEHQQQVHLWERRNKWGGWKVYGGHNIAEIFPPRKYASTHPEYYAFVNGKRLVPGPNFDNKHGGQVCTTEPGVISTAVEWVNNFYDNHPDFQGVHISMNDSGGFCECNRCRSLDSGKTMGGGGIDAQETKGDAPARKAIITDRIFTFANQVAEQVQKKHPGKYIFCFAYGPMILPPEKIQLHPYVVPQYTLWSAYKHANLKLKQEHETLAEEWAKKANLEAIYEYDINGSWPGMHRLAVPYFAQNIRYLKKTGIQLYQTQAGDEFSTNGLNYYVTGKLLWNASEDESEILDDFYEKGFENCASAVRRFHDRMQNAWADATQGGHDVTCNSIEDKGLAELFNEELLNNCTIDLDNAYNKAKTESVRNRVDFYRKGLKYTQLTVDAITAAKALGSNPNKQLISTALEAIKQRNDYVEELKNNYVLPYFWVQYNNVQRNFLPSIKHLEALLQKVDV